MTIEATIAEINAAGFEVNSLRQERDFYTQEWRWNVNLKNAAWDWGLGEGATPEEALRKAMKMARIGEAPAALDLLG